MSAFTTNTMGRRVARYALLGAVLVNLVTVVLAFYTSGGTTIVVAIVLAVLGGTIGGSFGWATASNRWGRWWAEGRTRRGSIRGSS
jgi:hypothetical protein